MRRYGIYNLDDELKLFLVPFCLPHLHLLTLLFYSTNPILVFYTQVPTDK